MEILILLLVSPAIFAQRYRKNVNPNDEPFLPIHPAYPYSPKLTKRGSDKDFPSLLKPELYAPRTDARDSYTASYASDPKDSFLSGYGPYPRSPAAAPYSPYSSYYGNSLYGAYMNPYTASPFTSGSHGSGTYPGYYQQNPYFYPDYYNQAFPYSFPPPDHVGPSGPPRNEHSVPDSPEGSRSSEKHEKPKSHKPKVKESSSSSSSNVGSPGTASPSQNGYVDGDNLISQSYKEVVAPSSVYKTGNSFNQVETTPDVYPNLPHTTYKVISVGGQPVPPNYPLPSTYARAQLLEQVAAVQNFAKSSDTSFPQQITGGQLGSQGIASYLPYTSTASQHSSLGKTVQDGSHYYSGNTSPRVPDAHVYGSEEHDLPEKEASGQFRSAPPTSPGKLTADPLIYGDNGKDNGRKEYATSHGEKNYEAFDQGHPSVGKVPGKYQGLPYAQKPVTRVTFEQSQGTYIAPAKIASTILDETSGDQVHFSQNIPFRNEQTYRLGHTQGHGPVSFQNQNLGRGTPQAFTYHLTNVHPFSQVSQHQTKTNLEDVNFGTKQGNKG